MKQCKITLRFLVNHPQISQKVESLIVRPNWLSLEWLTTEDVDEFVVTKLIEDLAPYLPNLKTFMWDGFEMPVNDQLWVKLRNSYVPFYLGDPGSA